MRKIAVVTGTRAEYGLLKPLMNAINKDKKLELIPMVTGMHFLKDYGDTYKLVEKDYPKHVKIPMSLKGDSLADMANYLASGVENFTKYLSKKPVDIVIVTGDRSEALAAAIACLYLNIPIAHINGGDVSGGAVDESFRHAITKMAHIHFAYTKNNAERIRKMGEEKKRIHHTGAVSIEAILNLKLKTKKELSKIYKFDADKPLFLVVQHPITTIKDKGYNQMKELFLALDSLKEQAIMLYPNCDAGSKKLIQLIEKYKKKDYLFIFKNLPHEDYISVMNIADVMIGNSSSGIIEAPTLKTPVVNIGNRQKGRERSSNIIDVEPKKDKILKAIKFAQTNKQFKAKVKNCKNKFGTGNASAKMVKILKDIKIDENLIQKQITY